MLYSKEWFEIGTVENKNTYNEKVVIGYVMNNMRGARCFDTMASLIRG